MTASERAARFARQADFVPSDDLRKLDITIVGVGAVGRQSALQLAAMGAVKLQLIDFDTVEYTNISSQGYFEADLGKPKVAATAELISRIDPAVECDTVLDRFRPSFNVGQVVFCCVDSIAARTAIWKSIKNRCHFWADARMLGEVIRVLIANERAGQGAYEQTLFAQAEAQVGACTARSTLYAASITAGLMLHQFGRWLRHIPTDADTTLNLLAGELSIMQTKDATQL